MYMVMQNNARAHNLTKARQATSPVERRFETYDRPFMTPPNTPQQSSQSSTLIAGEIQNFAKPQSLNQHPQASRSPKNHNRTKESSTASKYHLRKNEIELLKRSWSGVVQSSDPFDIVGDHYENISEACYSTSFWERCVEEIKMTNTQIGDSKSFVSFYSSQFADILKLSIDNINDLEKSKDLLVTAGKRHIRLFNSSELYFDLFRIAFLSALMDSFADGFTGELQTSWRNLLTIIIDLMDIHKQNSNLLREIEEETASMIGNDNMSFISTSTDSAFDSSYGSSLFTREDSTRTSRTSASVRSVSNNNNNNINNNYSTSFSNKVPKPAISSFYTKPPSLNRKSSATSLRSKESSSSKAKSSAVSITDSTNSISSSITTTSTGQKLYKGKPIPLFMQQDLQRIVTQSSSGSSSASSQDLNSSIRPNSKKSKANKFFNALLCPTGNLGPLIP